MVLALRQPMIQQVGTLEKLTSKYNQPQMCQSVILTNP